MMSTGAKSTAALRAPSLLFKAPLGFTRFCGEWRGLPRAGHSQIQAPQRAPRSSLQRGSGGRVGKGMAPRAVRAAGAAGKRQCQQRSSSRRRGAEGPCGQQSQLSC